MVHSQKLPLLSFYFIFLTLSLNLRNLQCNFPKWRHALWWEGGRCLQIVGGVQIELCCVWEFLSILLLYLKKCAWSDCKEWLKMQEIKHSKCIRLKYKIHVLWSGLKKWHFQGNTRGREENKIKTESSLWMDLYMYLWKCLNPLEIFHFATKTSQNWMKLEFRKRKERWSN